MSARDAPVRYNVTDYETLLAWKNQLQEILPIENSWDVLNEFPSMKTEEWKQANERALGWMRMTLVGEAEEKARGFTVAKDLIYMMIYRYKLGRFSDLLDPNLLEDEELYDLKREARAFLGFEYE